MQQIRPQQLAEWLSDDSRKKPVLLDVREPWEFELCKLPGSLHIPMHLVPLRSNELKPDDEIVVICHHGGAACRSPCSWNARVFPRSST
jgi:rhodanese-related sulfurtransferase